MSAPRKRSVLFICLGNICRSTMAEAVFLNLIDQRGQTGEWLVDSAGLGSWHVGNQPDRRTLRVLKSKNIVYSHRARQIGSEDFTKFDFIFGMDHDNIAELKKLAPKGTTAAIGLLGSYHPEGEQVIEDPYYERGDEGFYTCYEQCVQSCKGFLDSVDS